MPITSIDATDVNKLTSGQVIIEIQSVVKELVDNSLDAGSKQIEILFNNYGIKGIEVIDNGKGIDKDDYEALCLKHHTSKLSNFEDLESVSTLGFRGEALASLCAVARVKITTCSASTYPKAATLEYDSMGKLTSQKMAVSGKKGTSVIVHDLFYGLPVRQKYFAKNAKKEYSKALSLLVGYLLLYTDVRFVVYQISGNTGKKSMVMGTQGRGASVFDTLVSVYGSNGAHGLVPLDIATENIEARFKLGMTSVPVSLKFRLKGLILDYSFGMGRGALDRQFLYVNKRPVIHKKFTKILNEVYKTFNHTQVPVFVLDIEIDQTFVDINVTPDKRSVMVQNEDLLGEVLREEVTKFFDGMHNIVPKSDLGVIRLGSGLEGLDAKRKALSDSLADADQSKRLKQKTSRSLTQTFSSNSDDILKEAGSEPLPAFDMHEGEGTEGEGTEGEEPGEEEESREEHDKNNHEEVLQVDEEDDEGEDNGLEEEPQNDSENVSLLKESSEIFKSYNEVNQDPSESTRDVRHEAQVEFQPYRREHENVASEDAVEVINVTMGRGDIHVSDDAADDSFLFTEEAQLFVQQDETIDADNTGVTSDHESNENITKVSQEEADASVCATDEGENSDHKGHHCKHSLHDETFEVDESQFPTHSVGTVLGPADRPLTSPGNKSFHSEPVKGISRVLKLDKLDLSWLIQPVPAIKKEKIKEEKSTLVNVHDVREKLVIQKLDFPLMEVVGQFNLGFIVVKHEERLFIVDQHASDEIFNYERLHRLLRLRAQPLVIPRVLELSPIDEMLVLDQQEQLRKNGFVVREAQQQEPGKRVELVAVPVLKNVVFDDSDLHELVQRLHDVGPTQGSIVRCNKVDLMIALRACRLSIMVGQALNRGTMGTVVAHLAGLDKPWNCPHGRPTMRHLADLEGQGFTEDYEL